ncbi:MAG: bi-domain-containing oxidoreductase [Candidatus Neomarinimicrobiota bacterium]
MKQILQNLKTGKVQLIEVPTPKIQAGHLLIQTAASLVSKGTEKMLLEFGKASWLNKARQQPDKVKQVIDKIKTDGLYSSLKAVKTKLENPLPLGYCNAGIVIGVGNGVSGFEVGQRVISNGYHAEVVSVPQNLCAKIPENVEFEQAAFTILGSIALQGVRLLKPEMGETIVVFGLGLVGLLSVQILKANGCNVIGIDYDQNKLNLAEQFGAHAIDATTGKDIVDRINYYTQDIGADGVLIAASAKSNDIVHNSAKMCRKRGRIILVGVIGLELNRADFYEKELTFQVSCSYGPGRYDHQYEQNGIDYPVGFVRWTEQRNFETVMGLLKDRKLDVDSLISYRFPIHEMSKAYDRVLTSENALGIILEYPGTKESVRFGSNIQNIEEIVQSRSNGTVKLAIIGAGNYTASTLLPTIKNMPRGPELISIASKSGVNAAVLGKKYGFNSFTSDIDDIFSNNEINTVIITTRHDSHSELAIKGIEAGKNVYCEKPLAINPSQLEEIEKTVNTHENPFIMVGFNRRFAPMVKKIKSLIAQVPAEKNFIYTINAGHIPADHWVHDPQVGGGRIIGEACHFVDLLLYLADSKIADMNSTFSKAGVSQYGLHDNGVINLYFENGSIGTIQYFVNGHKSYSKEKLEIFTEGKVLIFDNFRSLRGYGWKNFRKQSSWKQNKGHANSLQTFMDAISNKTSLPIPFSQSINVTRTMFQLLDRF